MYPARLVSPYTGPHVHALATYQPRIVYTCARPSARGCAPIPDKVPCDTSNAIIHRLTRRLRRHRLSIPAYTRATSAALSSRARQVGASAPIRPEHMQREWRRMQRLGLGPRPWAPPSQSRFSRRCSKAQRLLVFVMHYRQQSGLRRLLRSIEWRRSRCWLLVFQMKMMSIIIIFQMMMMPAPEHPLPRR